MISMSMPGVVFAAEHFDDAAPRRATRNRRARDLDVHYVAVGGAERVGRRDADLVKESFVNRRDEAFILEPDESSDDRWVGLVEHGFDAPFAPARGRTPSRERSLCRRAGPAQVALADIEVSALALALVVGQTKAWPDACPGACR